MNYAGCKRKFDIAKYVANTNRMVRDVKAAGAAAGSSGGAGSSK